MIYKRYIPTEFGQIHLRIAGQLHKPPLVLLHQTASSSVMFERVMAHLANEFWLIAPDTPGFGESFKPTETPSVKLYADSIRQALTELGITKCHLLGHHTGASIAVQMAYEQPTLIDKLCLIGPPLMTKEQIAYFEKTLVPFGHDAEYVEAIWQRTAGKSATVAPSLLYREAVLTLQAGEGLRDAYFAVFEQDFASQAAQISCPTLVLAGEDDSLRASVEPTMALLQNGCQRIIPHAGTYICDEQPAVLAEILREFF